jgi:hypothetical protein
MIRACSFIASILGSEDLALFGLRSLAIVRDEPSPELLELSRKDDY